MPGISFLILPVISLLVCFSSSFAVTKTIPAKGDPVTLVRDGAPQAAIVIAATPTENAQLAAVELQTYIAKISGASLPIASDTKSPVGTLILVGKNRLTEGIPGLEIPEGRTRNFREEGFVIRTEGDCLILAGNDTEPYYGTRYAVAEFLRSLGVRWFLPGELGQVVPQMKTIVVKPVNRFEQPDFPMRNFWEHARGNMGKVCNEWRIHNLMNPDISHWFGIPSDGSLRGYLPNDEFKNHPEWFALERDGKRNPHHPCTTSEEMIHYVAEQVKDEARKGKRNSCFAPEDGNPRCWCDRCGKLANRFDGFGSNDRDPMLESSISNEWFHFVNRVMAEVHQEFPDYIIATNGYANRDLPPELPPGEVFNPHKNLTVMFANIWACTIHAYDDPKCWQMERQGQLIQQWCKLSDKVWIYNYGYTMLVNKGTLTPMVHRLRRNIPILKQWGIVGFHDQDESDWALTGLTTRIVRARLEWDTTTDVDALLNDYFEKWFGPSARPMQDYYNALEEAFDQAPQHGHEDVILPLIYTDKLMSQMDGWIREAEAAAKTDTEKLHTRIERLIYDNICAYVASEKAKNACDFAAALTQNDRLMALQNEMNQITPFMGWYPYPAYGPEWQKKWLGELNAKTNGPEGKLIALLPEEAAFRTDPFDDGRYERWQVATPSAPAWQRLKSTSGWDAQGLQDEKGHPYKGVAWYVFDVDVPADAAGRKVRLNAPSVVNEVWVWVNGNYAGHRDYNWPWYRPAGLDMDVSGLLKPGEKNRIALRVLCNYDVWGANGIYSRLFLYEPLKQ